MRRFPTRPATSRPRGLHSALAVTVVPLAILLSSCDEGAMDPEEDLGTCSFTFTLDGTTVMAQPGDEMTFLSENDRLVSVTAIRASESWSLRMLPPDIEPDSRPDASGQWDMTIQGDMGLMDPDDVIFATAPPFLAMLDLDTYTPRSDISGTVAGPVEVVSTSDPRNVDASWEFAIRYGPGLFTCVVS